MLEDVPPAPWLSMLSFEERGEDQIEAEHAAGDLIPSVRQRLAPRYAGSWFSHEAGVTTCNVGVTNGTPDDQAALESLRGELAPSMSLPIKVVSVPRSEAELRELADAFRGAWVDLRSDVELAALEVRVDLGKLVLSIPIRSDPSIADATALRVETGLRAAGFPDDGYAIIAVAHRGGGRTSS